MPVDAKFIFGVRTSETVTLTLTGHPGAIVPDLLIKTRGKVNDAVIGYDSGAWTATLVAGDYIVWMAVPEGGWFEGDVQFTLSTASTIVSYGDSTWSKLVAWLATSGAVRDPKYPPPPPLAAVPLTDQAWFSESLQTLKGTLSLVRSLDLHARLHGARP